MERTYVTPVVLVTAAFVAAGGYVHAREWFQLYRDVCIGAVVALDLVRRRSGSQRAGAVPAG